MRTKKTIRVEEVKNLINGMIACDITNDERASLCLTLEEILHRTGNYNGFKYLDGSHDWQNHIADYGRVYY